MTKRGVMVPKSALASFLVFGVLSGVTAAGDLSRYRAFQLGADLSTVTKQTEARPSDVKVVHRRPVLIQELEWNPQSLLSRPKTESVKDVILTFYDGELFRIVVNYDRYETAGLTGDDLVDAMSATYGAALKPAPLAEPVHGRYGEEEETLARWEDPQYRFDLIRSSYWPSFTLIGVLKRLESPAQAAIVEAKRLDDDEAPQRDAARILNEEAAAKAKDEKARLVNKPKFRL